MKRKPQISFGPSVYGVMTWTMDGKKIPETTARKHWDASTADWSIPAWQEMARVVMLENAEIESGVVA